MITSASNPYFTADVPGFVDGKPGKILQDIIALRKLVGGLKAEKKEGGPRFAVKDARVLMEALRRAGDELGMPIVAGTVAQVVTHHEIKETTPDQYGKQKLVTAVHCVSTIRFTSSDGSYLDFVGSGHGADDQDKAGGKASTYSWKDACIKALVLPDSDMVDTDDSGDSMPEIDSKKRMSEFIDRMNTAESIDDLKTIKEEYEKFKWGPQQRDMLVGAVIKNKGRIKNAV